MDAVTSIRKINGRHKERIIADREKKESSKEIRERVRERRSG